MLHELVNAPHMSGVYSGNHAGTVSTLAIVSFTGEGCFLREQWEEVTVLDIASLVCL